MTLSDEELNALLPSFDEDIPTWHQRLMLAIEQSQKQFGKSADESQKATTPAYSSTADSDRSELNQLVAKQESLLGTYTYGYWYMTAFRRAALKEVHATEPGCELPNEAETPSTSARPLRSKGKGKRS